MPMLAHSAVFPLPGNLPVTQLCLPLTRHRDNSPAFSCKFQLPHGDFSSTFPRKHKTRSKMEQAWEKNREAFDGAERVPALSSSKSHHSALG